jgi:ABC-2 type transport system permease protein
MPLWTGLASLFMPLGVGFLIFVARNPEVAERLGLISAKANLMAYSATDWPAYSSLLGQIIGLGGFFFFVLALGWVFGREFADGTLKDMLAVPVPRSSIVLAKFAVFAGWSLTMVAAGLIVGLGIGFLIGLPQISADAILQGSTVVAVSASLAIAVVTPFALFASIGRGYLLPVGAAVLTVMLTNLVSVAGWGEYFPWAVPALFAMGKSVLTPISYWIVFLTGASGIIATILWWTYADQSR